MTERPPQLRPSHKDSFFQGCGARIAMTGSSASILGPNQAKGVGIACFGLMIKGRQYWNIDKGRESLEIDEGAVKLDQSMYRSYCIH